MNPNERSIAIHEMFFLVSAVEKQAQLPLTTFSSVVFCLFVVSVHECATPADNPHFLVSKNVWYINAFRFISASKTFKLF
jgi:hypothetical protein